VCDLKNFISEYADHYTFFGACMDGFSVKEQVFPERTAVVLGNETAGISSELLDIVPNRIGIPRINQNRKFFPESLNVSLAAAIVCYEWTK
jgi:tRNA G18 (ribose-2'-O)-methylase SpoU